MCKEKIRYAVTGLTVAGTSALLPMVSYASESAASMDTVTSALTGGLTDVGTSMLNMVGKVVPIALPIVGAVMIVVFGIKVFRRVTGK